MKISTKILLLVIFASYLISFCNEDVAQNSEIHKLWLDCKLKETVPFEIFSTAVRGKSSLQNLKKKDIITIIDFSKPSTEERFYVIDLENKQILFKCLVAHGKNSGENFANSFSNESNSLQSSPGFYLTAETYSGDHGYSLRLDGLEKDINSNARSREIVIHGAEYVSEEFIKIYGRLGRSWGCPALPVDISKKVIDKISDGSCLFIYCDDKLYRENSRFLSK
jgi:hypothetical protein